MTTVPAQSFSAPARACVIAAARFIPGVCGVLVSSSPARTTRTPWYFHRAAASIGNLLLVGGLAIRRSGSPECKVECGMRILAEQRHQNGHCRTEAGLQFPWR